MEKIKPLSDVLRYRNDQLVLMFSRKKGISHFESLQLFEELKKWLWFLAQRDANSKPFAVFPEQSVIDHYWHEFILSTKDYHAFCDLFFGRYIHHVPTPDGILEDGSDFGVHNSLMEIDPGAFVQQKLDILRESMREVARVLGVETVKIWYRELPAKYYFRTPKFTD
ncbi:hypothetical protein M2165_000583 [Variovorax sp. TBS-050B]|uniref:hypothetical protein n=1 Tax=Variovorax sp. TBS-050B TaxID=2940551 RepID=UPI002475D49F|nr:hypothetical protein [Variovorax sp. TBS-050B]MDH6590694.1 hypothetical protein [Variovorax sp. TBS-050B]